MPKTLEERFEEKFVRGGENECWLWIACKDKDGYGVFKDRPYHKIAAHRFAWIVANNRNPQLNYVILHSCDTPSCVNPAHLIEGTNKDNTKDMISKGRHRNQIVTHCPSGHEYTEINTYIDKKGGRRCRMCAYLNNWGMKKI